MCTFRAFLPPPVPANPHAMSKKQFALLGRVQSRSTMVWQPLCLAGHRAAKSPRDKSPGTLEHPRRGTRLTMLPLGHDAWPLWRKAVSIPANGSGRSKPSAHRRLPMGG